MKVLFEHGEGDYGTPIEKAKAIIDAVMCNYNSHLPYEYRVEYARELSEIRDHIDVYLQYNNHLLERDCGVCQKS